MCWLDFLYTYSQEIKDIFTAIQSLTVAIGIFIGGIWAYWLFYKHRQKNPRANLSHEISHKILPDDKILLQFSVKVINVGNVIISLNKCDIRVQRVLPVNDKIHESIMNNKENYYLEEKNNNLDYEINWPILKYIERQCEDGMCEVEPSETEQLCFDFILDSNIETISIYTHFVNKSMKGKNEIGWSLTTIYDLK